MKTLQDETPWLIEMACDGDAKFITRDAMTIEDCTAKYANFCKEVNRTDVHDTNRDTT